MRNEIVEMLDREPFVPFGITLTSGEKFQIANPHLVALGQTQITVYQAKSDRFAILRLNQVASLSVLETAA